MSCSPVIVLENKSIHKVPSSRLVVLESHYRRFQILTLASFLAIFFRFMTHTVMRHIFLNALFNHFYVHVYPIRVWPINVWEKFQKWVFGQNWPSTIFWHWRHHEPSFDPENDLNKKTTFNSIQNIFNLKLDWSRGGAMKRFYRFWNFGISSIFALWRHHVTSLIWGWICFV